MDLHFAKNSMIVSAISGTLITGLSIYLVLTFLLIPSSITIPMSISISLLSLGLIRYYTTSEGKKYNTQSGNKSPTDEMDNKNDGYEIKISEYESIIIFVPLFLASLITCTFFSDPEVGLIFTSWNTIDAIEIIGLGAGIAISFFMPGYAVVLLLTRRFETNPVLKILLAYLFSMLITGLTVYLTEIFLENNIFENKNLLLGVNVVLLIAVVIYYRAHKIFQASSSYKHEAISIIRNKVRFLKRYSSEILVFGSLLSLLIISTNYLYGGITIGDQWYHQNRIILFMTGQFKEFVLSNGDEIYPPLQSALLAGLTTLSGIPLVNTFASIAFLNISAVFAFYYFCSIWLPGDNKKAALFASALFLIAAGFGWIYIISLDEANPPDSQIASIANFVQDKIKISDIRLSANFMIAAFPDFSTGLIYIALPAGFLLLGLVRAKFANRFQHIVILSLVTTLGVLSHDEFYIFIIIASTLPLIYNIEKKYSVYISLIIALAFTFALDTLLPVRYFTIQSIFGISLLYLVALFSLLMMILYALRQNLCKLRYSFAIRPFVPGMKIVNLNGKTKLITKMIFVGIAIYLYLLCFIVWDELPANFVDVHTQKYNTPWYMYPMRLGLIGLIGLALILSYVFKRYEKEVFVFGILVVIALLAGPYYNEQRFNKYVMAGMMGFAAILIFRVLRFLSEKKPILNGVIVSVIVVSASLSTLMYVGYNALVIQTQDYTHALDRRNFPSQEELHMYDILRSKIQLGPNPNNIASFANEYNLKEGSIMSKLHAFAGLPYMKIAQTEYLLNASTIDLFYHLLWNTNTKFLVIPISSINNQTLGNLMKFSLDSFQQVYHDDNFIVLGIPSLQGPSTTPQGEVGIIYKKDTSFLSTVQNKTQVNVNNTTFNLEKNDMKFVRINNYKQNETDNNITFYGYKKNGGKTIWSKEFGDNEINYLEFKFRINGENKTGKDLAGIKWIEGNKTYFLALMDKGLELRQQVSKDGDYILLSQNSEIKKDDWIWYSIKIQSLENSVKVYVDNLLKVSIQKHTSEIPDISKVGIFSENDAIEIEPITTGHTDTSEGYYNREITYGKYYPVSSLALSNSSFSSFIEDDLSALSKKFIILPFDPEYLSDIEFRTYLDYVKSGGTLIVINSDNSTGKFANFLSIENTANDTEKFTNIVKEDDQDTFLNVSGMVKSIKVNASSDLNVVASYFDVESKHSSPFAVERNLTNNGHIMYVNAKGYFDAIYDNPARYFSSLSNFSELLAPTDAQSVNPVPHTSEPIKRFIGDVEMSGEVSINGSSFSLNDASTMPYNLNVENISILDKHGKMNTYSLKQDITKLDISGQYEVIINSTGSMILPQTLSDNDYLQIALPSKFDMIIKVHDNGNKYSQVKIFMSNGLSNNTIVIDTKSTIIFNKVTAKSPLTAIPVLVKHPLIILEGDLKFQKTNFYGELNYPPLEISGNATARLNFIDHFNEPYRKGIKTQYIGYLESIDTDGKRKRTVQELKLPGDISSDVRKRGLDVPIQSIIISSSNIALIVTTIIGIAFTTWLIRKTHFYK